MKKVAVITGASHGIGKVVAEEFVKANYKVITIARSPSANYSLDVSNYQKVKKYFREISSRYKTIDVLVNVAGIQGPIGPLNKSNLSEWEETIRVNLLGTVYCAQEFIKIVSPNGGSIINFSGGGAFIPRKNFSAYASSKAAIVRFTETLAKELNPRHVRVNAVSPGAINTHMFDQMLVAGEKLVGQGEWRKLQIQKMTGGNDPHLTAKLCLWLASSKSKPLTGKTISAVYDDWRSWTKKDLEKLNSSDWYTMRRLDDFTLKKLP